MQCHHPVVAWVAILATTTGNPDQDTIVAKILRPSWPANLDCLVVARVFWLPWAVVARMF